MIHWLLPAIAGIFIFLALSATYWSLRAIIAAERARKLARMWNPQVADEEVLGLRAARLADGPFLRELLDPHPVAHELARHIAMAGMNITVARLFGQSLGASGVGFVAAVLLGIHPLVAVLYGAALGVVPLVLVLRKKAKRARDFDEQLANALELLVLALRAGRSLPQAFDTLAEELLPPASEEFQKLREEYRLGRSLESSLRAIGEKYPENEALRSLVVAITVLSPSGGNLVEIIEKIRRTIEMETQYRFKLRAMTGDSRMSAVILGSLPGAFLLLTAVTSPQAVNVLFGTPLGRVILFASFTLWAAGVLWLRALLRARPN